MVNSPAVALRFLLPPALLLTCLFPVRAEPRGQALSGGLDPILAEARALINAGRGEAALETLRGVNAEGEPRVALLRGVAYYHGNQPGLAIEQLAPLVETLPEESPERREAVQVLGLSRYLAGHVAESIPLLEQTRGWAAENAELTHVLGMAYIQTLQADKARLLWAGAYGLAPDSAAGRLVTAQMMIRAQLDELAEAELKAALEKDPRLPRANLLLGQTAIFRGRLDEGLARLRREIEINPGEAMAFYRMGDAYSRQLKWDEAVAALQRSIWLNPFFSGPYVLLGKAYSKRGDRAAAEGMLRQAIQYDPNNRTAHYLLGQLLQQDGRSEEARRELELAERLQAVTDR
jgi:tetratricopeptide (TPR) repeat protein